MGETNGVVGARVEIRNGSSETPSIRMERAGLANNLDLTREQADEIAEALLPSAAQLITDEAVEVVHDALWDAWNSTDGKSIDARAVLTEAVGELWLVTPAGDRSAPDDTSGEAGRKPLNLDPSNSETGDC